MRKANVKGLTPSRKLSLMPQIHHHHHHHHNHLSLNCKGHWGTTDGFATGFLHFSLLSTALWDLMNTRPVHSLMLSSHFFLCLPSFPFHCALQDGFGQTWWTGDMTISMQSASLYGGQDVFVWSNCLLHLGTDFLVGSVVSCSSTSFPWFTFFFGALLWGSMIQKHTGRWMWKRTASVISWNWEKYSCQSKPVSTLSMLLLAVLSWRVSQLGTLISYNRAQVFEACDCLKLLSIQFDLFLRVETL